MDKEIKKKYGKDIVISIDDLIEEEKNLNNQSPLKK